MIVGGTPGAVLLRYADFPPVAPSGTSSGTTGGTTTGGSVVDPNTMFLQIGNDPPTCGSPNGSYSCGHWHVSIGIPPQLFRPGVLSLGRQDLISFESLQGPDRGGGDCYGGGGSFFQGTLEIVSIDDNGGAVVRLANTSTYDFNANGTYRAARCR